ncbi:MAG: AbrB/MazE/SpoVT family DNA-binding domain-containing protein [Candidatus Eremiobacterota bacterium]
MREKGQVTIPKELRDRYGLHEGVDIEFIPEKDGIRIRKRSRARHPVEALYGLLRAPGSTDAYIQQIRGEDPVPGPGS